MGAAWRNVKDGPEFDQVLEMVRINKLEMEVCWNDYRKSSPSFSRSGLYAYNLITSEEYYKEVISTSWF
jgi:biotin synthase